jgi:DNA (cytosine-5)-methyltransferase 1
VFVVGCLGDWRSAAAVLFERHSLSGNPAPSREKRQGVTSSFGTGANNSKWPAKISSTLDTTFGTKQGLEDQHVNAGCPMFVPSYGIPGNWIGRKPENGGNATEPMHDIAPCLTKTDKHGVAQPMAYNIAPGKGILKDDIHITNADAAKTLDASGSNPAMHQGGAAILQKMAVRRLLPRECERLQGFPDDYTDIKPNGKQTSDGPRYKALGNSMAVPVMAWIGKRIQEVENIK